MHNEISIPITGEFRGKTLGPFQRFLKRSFDVFFSAFGLLATGWLVGLAILAIRIAYKQPGIFRQKRVGLNGRIFEICKLRTMRDLVGVDTTVTTTSDPRITRLGRLFRKTKIDELPQLYNVLRGDMSFVGPRPDVPEVTGTLRGDDRIVLTIRPGITGPASIKYRREEELLATQPEPEAYNMQRIYPDKTRINREYVERYRFLDDFVYVIQTVLGGGEMAQPEIAEGLERERAA